MAKILFLSLFCLAGWLVFNGGHLSPRPNTPLKLSGQEKVVLYATDWCGYCAKTRRFFADNHIPYQEWNIEHSDIGRTEYQKLGGGGIPIIVVNESTVIRGYDPDAIIEALHPQP